LSVARGYAEMGKRRSMIPLFWHLRSRGFPLSIQESCGRSDTRVNRPDFKLKHHRLGPAGMIRIRYIMELNPLAGLRWGRRPGEKLLIRHAQRSNMRLFHRQIPAAQERAFDICRLQRLKATRARCAARAGQAGSSICIPSKAGST
jgi:hypothetical protein